MALGRGSDLLRSSFLLSKGSGAFRGCGHLEARTACRSETHMPLVLILGQSPRGGPGNRTRPGESARARLKGCDRMECQKSVEIA